MKSFLKQIDENFKRLDEKDWDGDGNVGVSDLLALLSVFS